MTSKKINAPFANQHATTRRDFLKTAVVGSLAYGTAARTGDMAALAAPLPPAAFQRRKGKAETLVATLHRSLTEPQKQVVAFDFYHPLQSKVDNNWRITPPLINDSASLVCIGLLTIVRNPTARDEFFRKLLKNKGIYRSACTLSLYRQCTPDCTGI